jgi:alpha-L-arabinofuranosidase
MPKPRVPESKLTINYWQNFLRAKNLLGPIMQETEEIEAKRKPAPPTLEPDMQTFIDRVAERLTPLEGLDQTGKLRALNVREQFRRELTDVFLGKQDWNKWFDKTKTTLGLHTVTFMKMLYQCLEGLRSPEAQSLRQDYEAALARIRTSA